MKMEIIEKLTNELDVEITRVWGEYVDLYNDLDKYRGKPIEDNFEAVNIIITALQEKFAILHPAYHFIAIRHDHVANATNSYNDFIELLKKAGAKTDQPESKIIMQ